MAGQDYHKDRYELISAIVIGLLIATSIPDLGQSQRPYMRLEAKLQEDFTMLYT